MSQKKKINKVKSNQGSNPIQGSKNKVQNRNDKPISTKFIVLILLVISLLTYIAYYPSLKNDFTNWDDNSYVLENPVISELSKANISEMFFSKDKQILYYMGNYHPLTMLSLSIDHKLETTFPNFFKKKGMDLRNEKGETFRDFDPYIYHLHNVLLHILNTLLVFAFVFLLFKEWDSPKRLLLASFTALLFAVTTLHVESVTWISERKDVLYAFYFLISAIFYLKYLSRRNYFWFAASLLAFLLSLLSKGQAVSLAVSLVAIDIFAKRTDIRAIVLEKIPYFALALAFGIIAIKAQAAGEAIHNISDYAFYHRILFAAYGLTMYFVKLLIPNNLAAVYPYPVGDVPAYFWAFLIPAGVYVAAFVYFFKRNMTVAFALAFFVINIFLVLQLLPVGSAIMADRYAYVPSVGFALLLAYLLVDFGYKNKTAHFFTIALFAGYSLFLIVKTTAQAKLWKDSNTLWEHTLGISPTAVVAWNNWGSAIDKIAAEQKNPQEKVRLKALAISKFDKAVEIKTDYAHAFYNRGTSRKDIGLEVSDAKSFEMALTDFNKAIEINKEFAEAYQNRAITYENLGKFSEALSDFDIAIKFKPTAPDLYSGRGVVKGKMGKFEEAIADFTKSIEVNPNHKEGYSNRGYAYYLLGNTDQALKDYNMALAISPDNPDALFNRGVAYAFLKKPDLALADYNQVQLSKPNMPMLYINRGLVLVALNKANEACADFAKAQALGSPFAQQYLDSYCKR